MRVLAELFLEIIDPYYDFYYLAGQKTQKAISQARDFARQERELKEQLLSTYGAKKVTITTKRDALAFGSSLCLTEKIETFGTNTAKFDSATGKLIVGEGMLHESITYSPEEMRVRHPVVFYFEKGNVPNNWIAVDNKEQPFNLYYDIDSDIIPAVPAPDSAAQKQIAEKVHAFVREVDAAYKTNILVSSWRLRRDALFIGDEFSWKQKMFAFEFGLELDKYGIARRAPVIYDLEGGEFVLSFRERFGDNHGTKARQYKPPKAFADCIELSKRDFETLTSRNAELISQRVQRVKQGRSARFISERLGFK
jgi:hypothetical protein